MKQLTEKEKGFVKDYKGLGTGSKTVKKHYEVSSDESARAIASENLTKLHIIQAIADRIPDDLLEQVHLEGLKASKEVWKNNNESGEIEKVSEEPDYAVRHKYLDSAYKLKGSYAPERLQSVAVNVDIKIENKEMEDLRQEYEEKLKVKLLN